MFLISNLELRVFAVCGILHPLVKLTIIFTKHILYLFFDIRGSLSIFLHKFTESEVLRNLRGTGLNACSRGKTLSPPDLKIRGNFSFARYQRRIYLVLSLSRRILYYLLFSSICGIVVFLSFLVKLHIRRLSSVVEQHFCKVKVLGSNPRVGSANNY